MWMFVATVLRCLCVLAIRENAAALTSCSHMVSDAEVDG